MSQQQIDRLREFLLAEGYAEGSLSERAPGFTLEAGESHNSIRFVVEVPLDTPELPEELVPFELSEDELERAIWKRNSEKRTWSGARFEMALRSYAGSIMEKDPEAVALRERVSAGDPSLGYEEWEAQRKAIWKRICSEPQIAAWERQLEAMY